MLLRDFLLTAGIFHPSPDCLSISCTAYFDRHEGTIRVKSADLIVPRFDYELFDVATGPIILTLRHMMKMTIPTLGGGEVRLSAHIHKQAPLLVAAASKPVGRSRLPSPIHPVTLRGSLTSAPPAYPSRATALKTLPLYMSGPVPLCLAIGAMMPSHRSDDVVMQSTELPIHLFAPGDVVHQGHDEGGESEAENDEDEEVNSGGLPDMWRVPVQVLSYLASAVLMFFGLPGMRRSKLG